MGTARAEQLRKRLAQGLAARPILRGALRALGAGCFCFVLAGAGLLSEHVPLALAPVCVLPFGPAAVCAYLGAAAGYAMFWGLSSALEPVAAGFLMLAGSCLFRELLPAQRRGFVPAAAGGIYALLGLIFVLQADGGMRAALLLALRLTLLVVSIRALCPAEENARLRPYAAAVCLLAGLVRVELPFGVPLAAVEAAAVCLLADSMEDALLIGAACGLVLDLGSVPSPPQTACFCLPLLVCRMANLRRTARAAAFAGLYFLCVLVWGGEHAGWTLGVLAGAAMNLAILTVVGRCVGAHDNDQVRYYTRKLLKIEYAMMVAVNVVLLAALPLILNLYTLSPASRELATQLVFIHDGFAMLLWPLALSMPNALRAANDVKFTMVLSIGSMVCFRIALSYIVGVKMGYGALGVWFAMLVDWLFRAAVYTCRFEKGKWENMARI